MNNVSQISHLKCYGCTACECICPKNAITMEPDKEGFLFPCVDLQKCVNCGLCLKVCNANELNKKVFNEPARKVYAAWNKDEKEVIKSTSGGLFFTIASHIVESGGVVYAVVWNNRIEAVFARIDKIDDLQKARGSKYVQSDIRGTYKKIQLDLEKGLTVLFVGTPCQVSGLKSYLRKDFENLYLIDFVCHGTPSPKMLSAYIDYIQEKEKKDVIDFKCRGKLQSGWRAYEIIGFRNSPPKISVSGLRPYLFGFNQGLFNRESCFDCAFSRKERTGDITLSDFWGAEKFHPDLKKIRKLGLNAVMINSAKGESLFREIKNRVQFIESDLNIAIAGDRRLSQSDPRPPKRNVVYKILDERGFDYLARNYLRPKYYLIRKIIPNWLKNIYKEFSCRI